MSLGNIQVQSKCHFVNHSGAVKMLFCKAHNRCVACGDFVGLEVCLSSSKNNQLEKVCKKNHDAFEIDAYNCTWGWVEYKLAFQRQM